MSANFRFDVLPQLGVICDRSLTFWAEASVPSDAITATTQIDTASALKSILVFSFINVSGGEFAVQKINLQLLLGNECECKPKHR